MTPIAYLTSFRTANLHDPVNGRYCLEAVKITLSAKVKLFELPDSVLYNPYGGGLAPIYPQKLAANFLFRGATPVAVQTMYQTVVDQLAYTSLLYGKDANDDTVNVSAILERIVRTDNWAKAPSNVIKFQLTFQPLTNDWTVL